jgi:hypothetical protein
VPTTDPFVIVLKPGWNQIGPPYFFDVLWSDQITVRQGADSFEVTSESNTLTKTIAKEWDGALGQYVDATVLRVGNGYWFKNLTESDVEMLIPPNEYIATSRSLSQAKAVASDDDDQPPPPPAVNTTVDKFSGRADAGGGGCSIIQNRGGPSSGDWIIAFIALLFLLFRIWIPKKRYVSK